MNITTGMLKACAKPSCYSQRYVAGQLPLTSTNEGSSFQVVRCKNGADLALGKVTVFKILRAEDPIRLQSSKAT